MPKTSQAILLTGGDPAGIAPEIIPAAIRYWQEHADVPLVYFCTAGGAHIERIVSEFSASVPVEIIRDRSAVTYIDEIQKERRPSTQAQNADDSFWVSKRLLLFDLPSLLPCYANLQPLFLYRSSYIESPPLSVASRSSYLKSRSPETSHRRSEPISGLHRKQATGNPDVQNKTGQDDRNSYFRNPLRPIKSRPGKPDELTGLLALLALEEACHWIERLGCLGLVTAPLSKEHVDAACQRLDREAFLGHTGFLAKRFSCGVAMLMHGQNFSVLPLTTHIALRDVPEALKRILLSPALEKLLKKICSFSVFANKGAALCALNPHGGEGGLMGTEEQDFLASWAQRIQKQGIPIEGPLAADGLFIESVRKNYRLFLACYHDQGLIPFKAIEGAKGVNVTIGLPFLRTSPDHGTAFGIAGHGLANPASMVRAIALLLSEEFACV